MTDNEGAYIQTWEPGDPDPPPEGQCRGCDGTGQRLEGGTWYDQGASASWVTCYRCHGSKKTDIPACRACLGTGYGPRRTVRNGGYYRCERCTGSGDEPREPPPGWRERAEHCVVGENPYGEGPYKADNCGHCQRVARRALNASR